MSGLLGARHKVARAEYHLNTFNAECADFLREGNAYRVRIQDDQNHRRYWLELMRPIPVDLMLKLGDFIHNLRSALDHVVGELAMLHKGSSRNSLFPIVQDVKDWEIYDRQSRKLSRASGLYKVRAVRPEVLALIEGLQPFKTRQHAHRHPLAMLSELDNRDKHHTLNVAITTLDFMVTVSRGQSTKSTFTRKGGAIKDETTLLEEIELPSAEMEVNFDPVLGLVLNEGPAMGQPLWSPGRKQLLMQFGPRNAPALTTLPDELLLSVVGIISLLEPWAV